MTANQLLTPDQLGRYLGKPIQYEYKTITGDWETAIRPMTINTLSASKDYIRNVKPMLRRKENITEAEAIHALKISGSGYKYAAAVSDYLDSIGIDTRGLIDAGLAVEQSVDANQSNGT